MLSLTICVRVRNRIRPAKEAAIKTYDRRRMMGGSKDDATTAAFMAQAYHICTAFDFFCFPCFAVGCCRGDSANSKYARFDEEEGFATPGAADSYRHQIMMSAMKSGTKRSVRGNVSTARSMFETGNIQPRSYDPPPPEAPPLPLVLPPLTPAILAALPAPPGTAAATPPAAGAAPAAPEAPPPADGAAAPAPPAVAAPPPEAGAAAAPAAPATDAAAPAAPAETAAAPVQPASAESAAAAQPAAADSAAEPPPPAAAAAPPTAPETPPVDAALQA